MFPPATTRLVRPVSTILRTRRTTTNDLILRTFATKKSSQPPSSTVSARSKPPPRPKPNLRDAHPQARQTSPGASLPKQKIADPQSIGRTAKGSAVGSSSAKDATWKPSDGIKFAKPTGAVAGASTNRTPIEGARPIEPRPSLLRDDAEVGDHTEARGSLPERDSESQSAPDSLRDRAHGAQAAAENTEIPSQAQQPQKPLPDLRHGIPSTFQMEFGQAAKDAQDRLESDQKFDNEANAGRDFKIDLTSASEGQGRGEREEREYDRSAYETSLDRRWATTTRIFYLSIIGLSTLGGFWLSRPVDSKEELPSSLNPDDANGWVPGKMWARVKARASSQLGYYTEPTFPRLLPEVPEADRARYTLVLSLEDLLVHSSWDRANGYRIAKRPGVDYFIRYLSQYYELVLFTSAPKMMSDPVMMKLDPFHFVLWQLGREATKYEGGEYIKDLSYLNRPLNKTLIIDTHAGHVKNQPENAIVLPKWNGDPKDPHAKDLVGLIPFLEYIATMNVDDIRTVLKSFEGKDIALEFAARETEARQKFLAELERDRSKRPRRSLGGLGSALGIKGGMGGNMILADGTSVADGLAQGKMLSDQFREQGQKQYEFIEKQLRENGAQWLKEEEEEQKKAMEAHMKEMKKGGMAGWMSGIFGGPKPE